MLRKGLAVAVILLFIGMCVVPSTAVTELKEKPSPMCFDGNTLYVGGTGEGNYTTIQEAIDNSSDGDTVFVYNGIYSDYFPDFLGCVNINKSINLIGEDKYNTIIDGGYEWHVVQVKADEVTVSGFTIRNSGDPGIGVFISSDVENIFIHDNIILENTQGIVISSILLVNIFKNIISYNWRGIYLSEGNNCYIYENLITNNSVGISLSEGKLRFIHHNLIRDNELGLEAVGCRATIFCNNFINNDNHSHFYNIRPRFFRVYGKQHYIRNYWDDWNKKLPRPIRGEWYIYYYFIWGPFPDFPQFDWLPAIIPYDIEVL